MLSLTLLTAETSVGLSRDHPDRGTENTSSHHHADIQLHGRRDHDGR
jgi:hypothetical protein